MKGSGPTTATSPTSVSVVSSGWYKRPFDLGVLIVAHVALLPVWIVLWSVIPLAIWMGSGRPIFYGQTRLGKGGRAFTLLKFRTMVNGADAAGLVTAEHDPRVTRVGRVLRRTALDELPQMINIVRGETSFVGPRALPPRMHEEATLREPRFPERLKVTPGLTGFSQVYLPRHCSPRHRLAYDLFYIRNAGLWLDVRLMLVSVWNTLVVGWKQAVVVDTHETSHLRETEWEEGEGT